MHGTGLGCTSLHGFRTTAIFYQNFYPKVQQSGAEMLYALVIPANWSVRLGYVTSLPSWSCGFDSRRPLQFTSFFSILCFHISQFKSSTRPQTCPCDVSPARWG